MFELTYKVVPSEYDDFMGQNGFFQIKCNGYKYGEMYPKELEIVMDKVSVYDWFQRLIKVIKNLMTKEYVVLSNVESYNTWIEFRRKKEGVIISIVNAEKGQGSADIEFNLKEPVAGEWTNQVMNFNQLKREVIEKGKEYINYLVINNTETPLINKLKQEFEEML